MRTKTSTRLALVLLAISTIGCDRVTKHAASSFLAGMPARTYLGDTVRLTYAENIGGFLSLGATLPPAIRIAVFTAVTGLCLLLMVVVLVRWERDVVSALSLTLFAAGGLSNWVDRVVRGSVIDFMNLGVGSWRTGIFNVADVAIMVGACLFVMMEVRRPTNSNPRSRRRDVRLSRHGADITRKETHRGSSDVTHGCGVRWRVGRCSVASAFPSSSFVTGEGATSSS